MDKIQAIKEATKLFDDMNCDPQVVCTIIQIAKWVKGDPQKIRAIVEIAKFLKE